MATDNLKDMAIEWTLFSLLFFSLFAFATTFMFQNNADGFGTANASMYSYQTGIQANLQDVENSSNDVLTTLKETDPEVSDQGSKDSVATAYEIKTTPTAFFGSFKLFLGWMISGTAGQLLITVLAGMLGLSLAYFIYKSIRIGA